MFWSETPAPAHCVLWASLLLLPSMVEGHGRLLEPPSRASMWRLGFNTPPNYDDNQLFCGGYQRQWERNNGKCGVCGDPWDGIRENEAGGKYANGIIVRKYNQGETIRIDIDLTANHKGYFEFRLCPNNDPSTPITQQCLDRHLLKHPEGSTRFFVTTSRVGKYNMEVILPAEVTCSQCVLQWKYNAGNSWGCETSGHCCVGCGPQEQFYGCADVAILSSNSHVQTVHVTPSGGATSGCSASGLWTGNSRIVTWCKTNCALGNCPSQLCSEGCRHLGNQLH
ncbi:uncharacterized protein LOC124267855 [Haliotis rubra]|uniref:uncharacterized protein LOC124267855 n=1 Tax=Haliotis rubra TaxID=36100 RepID=UPI001EE51E19|nr:uncharacterized protein LOC124267855 [Haliotis rubra]